MYLVWSIMWGTSEDIPTIVHTVESVVKIPMGI